MKAMKLICAALMLAAAPVAAEAQGLVGGAEQGYHAGDRAGDRALGPVGGVVGGVVGGAVGGAVGTVNGALGIHPRGYGRYARRCIYRHGRRYCRY